MKNSLFKILTALGLPWLLRKTKGQAVTILCFHRISDQSDFFFDPIRPAAFERLVEYCKRHYHITTFARVAEASAKPKLIFSFDDGYYDFIENAIPILAKQQLPCNHNLVNSCLSDNMVIWTQQLNDLFNHLRNNNITNNKLIAENGTAYAGNWMSYYNAFFQKLLTIKAGERSRLLSALLTEYSLKPQYRMMNWEDVKQAAEKYGVEIGCHSFSHDSLSTLTTKEELDNEIGRSLDEMKSRLGIQPTVMALPNGQYNESVLHYLEEKGIKQVLLLNDKLATLSDLDKPFALINRINMGNEPYANMILRAELFHEKIKKII